MRKIKLFVILFAFIPAIFFVRTGFARVMDSDIQADTAAVISQEGEDDSDNSDSSDDSDSHIEDPYDYSGDDDSGNTDTDSDYDEESEE